MRKEGQEAEAKTPELRSTVFLNCYDYGGWTQVMATAELADGGIVIGQVMEGSKSSQLAIPQDDNRNHIADRWEVGRTVIQAASYTDAFPAGNGVEGDGLSQYEEYRGFRRKGGHIRTDPVHKDLLIYNGEIPGQRPKG